MLYVLENKYATSYCCVFTYLRAYHKRSTAFPKLRSGLCGPASCFYAVQHYRVVWLETSCKHDESSAYTLTVKNPFASCWFLTVLKLATRRPSAFLPVLRR